VNSRGKVIALLVRFHQIIWLMSHAHEFYGMYQIQAILGDMTPKPCTQNGCTPLPADLCRNPQTVPSTSGIGTKGLVGVRTLNEGHRNPGLWQWQW
jgi:hypothetical protein